MALPPSPRWAVPVRVPVSSIGSVPGVQRAISLAAMARRSDIPAVPELDPEPRLRVAVKT